MTKQKEIKYLYDYLFKDLKPSTLSGTRVILKHNDNITRSLQTFKRKVKDSDKLLEYKDRGEFIKPSAKTRKQKQRAVRKQYRQDIIDKLGEF